MIRLNSWNGLSLRIIALFATAMLVSYSPDYLRDFFGDTLYEVDERGWWPGRHDMIDDKWDWGYRHCLYFTMCCTLFVVQVARIWKWIEDKRRDWNP